MNEQQNLIVEVTTLKDGTSAVDCRGNSYKIESIVIGAGYYRRVMKWEKNFIKPETELRAEVLPNGKLNIIPLFMQKTIDESEN